MEKNVVITVDDRLIDLINRVEQKIVDDGNTWQLPVSWCFDTSGIGASGFGIGIEFGCSVGTSVRTGKDWVSVSVRDVHRHEYDNWTIHPFDDDYEEPEVA
jgi:hypothetical protein